MFGKLIMASFGTSSPSAAMEMDALMDRLEKLSPIPSQRIFLSHANSIEAIDSIGNERACILPILVQKGGQYRRLLGYGLPTGDPLLGSQEDARKAAEILDESLERKHGRIYIIAAHGSERKEPAELEMLRGCLRSDMVLATLMENGMQELPKADEAVIVPFLLASGHHVQHDIRSRLMPSLQMPSALIDRGLLSLSEGFSRIFEDHMLKLLGAR